MSNMSSNSLASNSMASQPINPLWAVCTIVRLLLGIAIIHRTIPRHIAAPLLAAMGVGFATQYLMKRPGITQRQFAKVFWHNDRPIHAGFFVMAAGMVMIGRERFAGGLVVGDLLFSIVRRFG
jgi:hypothetical protein